MLLLLQGEQVKYSEVKLIHPLQMESCQGSITSAHPAVQIHISVAGGESDTEGVPPKLQTTTGF